MEEERDDEAAAAAAPFGSPVWVHSRLPRALAYARAALAQREARLLAVAASLAAAGQGGEGGVNVEEERAGLRARLAAVVFNTAAPGFQAWVRVVDGMGWNVVCVVCFFLSYGGHGGCYKTNDATIPPLFETHPSTAHIHSSSTNSISVYTIKNSSPATSAPPSGGATRRGCGERTRTARGTTTTTTTTT